LDGTIDTTRTVHFGTPSEEEKDAFTRVLLGNLDLERVVWPADAGISGAELDILARRRLWQKGMDYAHGTGHGVGYFLNVHEGPQGISRARKTVLQPGMNVTNEPGYYLPGRFGIRIENVLFVKEQDHLTNFLGFENVTMVPYDRNLISTNLLDDRDKAFINTYHSKIFTVLSPLLESKQDLLTLEWLQKQTSPL
jgi:Xaa-Pro aminopeptidase